MDLGADERRMLDMSRIFVKVCIEPVPWSEGHLRSGQGLLRPSIPLLVAEYIGRGFRDVKDFEVFKALAFGPD